MPKRKKTKKEVFTTQEVAEILRYPQKTIQIWLRSGTLKGFKLGTHWRIPRSEIEKLIPALGVKIEDD